VQGILNLIQKASSNYNELGGAFSLQKEKLLIQSEKVKKT